MTRSRTWVAYLAGIVACAAASALCLVGWVCVTSKNESPRAALPSMFLIVFLVALVHAVLFGAPFTAWLRKRGWFGVLPMVLGGCIAGVLPVLLVLSGSGFLSGDFGLLATMMRRYEDLLLFATLGATGALAFYGAFRLAQSKTAPAG